MTDYDRQFNYCHKLIEELSVYKVMLVGIQLSESNYTPTSQNIVSCCILAMRF